MLAKLLKYWGDISAELKAVEDYFAANPAELTLIEAEITAAAPAGVLGFVTTAKPKVEEFWTLLQAAKANVPTITAT